MRQPGDNPAAVDKLLESPRLWKGRSAPRNDAGLATGYPALDRRLPGGGWPQQALTEILVGEYGIGELRLLMPALARLSNRQGTGQGTGQGIGRGVGQGIDHDHPAAEAAEPGWVAWIAPPFQPYPPALEQWGLDLSRVLIVRPAGNDEMLWSAEQALASGTCAAVLLWPARFSDQAGRRLQLAAEKGHSWAIAFRPLAARMEPSAAALRIALEATPSGTRLNILKSRGGRPSVLHDLL